MSYFTVHTFAYMFLLTHVVFTIVLKPTVAEPRVINGTTVDPPHKYPWMVSIFYAGCFASGTCPTPRHNCGGVILDAYHVLTAAHCCFPDPSQADKIIVKDLYILTAAHERNNLSVSSQNLSIAECIPHELYEHGDGVSFHDIAVLRARGRIVFGDKATPVNLPLPDFDVEVDYQDSAGEFALPKELQQVELPLLNTDTCQRILNQGSSASAVTDSMLCAGVIGGLKGGCYGDSGGPVMVLNPVTKTYTQVGIVSTTTPPCGSHPTVLTRLSSYVHWVDHHLQKCKPRTLKTTRAFVHES